MKIAFGLAFVFTVFYLIEVAMFLRGLRTDSESDWVALGSPGLFDLSRQVPALALLVGIRRLPASAGVATRAHLLAARVTGLIGLTLMMVVLVRDAVVAIGSQGA